MSTISLFRKWRSQSFEDLVGQESVVRTLCNALNSGSPARAYLFCGPRGTGKTSTARIFAKALNCVNGPTSKPCNECSLCRRVADGSCMDVLEIDAASHTQVDKIREFIVDKVHFAPAEARYKVYIIDEVHKLSTSSFNALLKTLEEPPPHVVFILATTHPHELLPTILSRCQRHDFLRLTPFEIQERLGLVAREEGIELSPDAARILARSAEGSLRDALVQLEQVSTFAAARVTEEDVRTLLGLAGRTAMNQFVAALSTADARAALQTLHDLVQSGRDLGRLSGELVDHLRRLLLISVKAADGDLLGIPPEEMTDLEAQASGLTPSRLMGWLKAAMDLQGEARDAHRARLLWEMMLIRLTVPGVEVDLGALSRRVERLEAAVAAAGGGAPSRSAQPAPPRREVPVAAEARGPATPAVSRIAPTAAQDQPVLQAAAAPAPPRPVRPRDAEDNPSGRRPAEVPGDLGWGEPVAAPNARASLEARVPAAAGVASSQVPAAEPPGEKVGAAPAAPPADAREAWQRLLTILKDRDRRLQAVLVDARVQKFEAGELAIAFPSTYSWHFSRFQEGQAVVEAVAREVLGPSVRVTGTLGGQIGEAPPAPAGDEHRSFVSKAGSLFNGRVVGEPPG